MTNLVNMEKLGVVLSVNPACVEAHKRQGWVTTEADATGGMEAEHGDDAPEADAALQTARAEYKELAGKAAYQSWDVDAINAKIEELTKPG